MELTEFENNRLGSFKEQLSSIKTEIEVANSKLEGLLGTINKAREDFNLEMREMNLERIKLSEEIANLVDKKDEEFHKLSEEKHDLLNEVYHHGIQVERLQYQAKALENTILSLEHQHRLTIDSVEVMKRQASEIAATLSVLSEVENDSYGTSKSVMESAKDSIEKLKYANSQMDLVSIELNRSKHELELKRKEIDDIELEKQTKMTASINSLRTMEESLSQREKMLRVVYMRTKKAWEHLYPGQNLDNVIKI